MKDIYVIFDKPPNPEASTFIDVENSDGKSLSPEQTGATWTPRADGLWNLGPFATMSTAAPEQALLEKVVVTAAELVKHPTARGDYWDIYDRLKEALDELDQLRSTET